MTYQSSIAKAARIPFALLAASLLVPGALIFGQEGQPGAEHRRGIPRPSGDLRGQHEEDSPDSHQDPLPSSAPAATVSAAELQHKLSSKALKLLTTAENHAHAGNHAKAIEELRQALAVPTAAPYAHSLLGSEYLKAGRIEEAVRELQEAVIVLPTAINLSNFSYALWLTGEAEWAELEIRKSLALEHDAPQAHYVLGVILLDKSGNDGEALHELQIAARGVRSAHLALALYYAHKGEEDPACQHLREYLGPERAAHFPEAEGWLGAAASRPRLGLALGFASAAKHPGASAPARTDAGADTTAETDRVQTAESR